MSIIKTHDITLYGGNGSNIILHPLCDDHLPFRYEKTRLIRGIGRYFKLEQ